jgi:hypothetical protein
VASDACSTLQSVSYNSVLVHSFHRCIDHYVI